LFCENLYNHDANYGINFDNAITVPVSILDSRQINRVTDNFNVTTPFCYYTYSTIKNVTLFRVSGIFNNVSND
jgi:hypothetical protein